MQVTKGMIGQGFYNRNSAPQFSAISHVLPWLDGAVDSMDISMPTITLADFGCSEGKNSVAVMDHLIAACRKRTDAPINTIHSDLPTNDFSQLFLRLSSAQGGGFDDGVVYSSVVGGSMFDQLLPPSSVTLATTFNAIGFLSCRPLPELPGYILPNGPSQLAAVGHVSATEETVFANQAHDDLCAFARARATEIAPGGKLLIQVFGADENRRTCDGIYDVLNAALLDAVDQGLINLSEYQSYYQPVYFRRLSELTRPFEPGNEAGDLFTLEQSDCYEVPVPFVQDYENTGDLETYAAAYVNFFRAFTETGLRLNFAQHPTLDRLVAFVFDRAEQLVQENPEAYEFHYVALGALLTRTIAN